MINVEIIKVHAGKILPCRRVTGNKEFTIGGLIKNMKCGRAQFLLQLIIAGSSAFVTHSRVRSTWNAASYKKEVQLYCKQGKIRWAKHLRFSRFSRVPQNFFHD